AVNEALRGLLDALVNDLACETARRIRDLVCRLLQDIRRAPTRLAGIGSKMEATRARARDFLYARLYNAPGMEADHTHASKVVQELFTILLADPKLLPPDHQAEI